MLEALFSLLEGLWSVLELAVFLADLAVAVADLYSWIRGRANRHERRLARRSGQPVPPRDRWNRRVLWLSLLALTLTIALLAWRLIGRT